MHRLRTTSRKPFIFQSDLKLGAHVSLVGAFTRGMAELDPQALPIVKLFADSREAVLDKGGEVWQALRDGLIQPSAIAAELRDIVAPQFNFSRTETDITVWKSVGFAELDLITAEMILNGMS